jgi:7-cyano-7-deazaguanine synthase
MLTSGRPEPRALKLPFGEAIARDQALAVVLLSGGLDSTTLLLFARAQGLDVRALHVDYGQAAASAEQAAVARICAAAEVNLQIVRYAGKTFGPGEIRGRNALLLHVALTEFPADSGIVLLGAHGGTDYRDCTPEFIELMQRSFDFHSDGAISVSAPFVELGKGDVIRLGLDLGIDVGDTYSCEAANQACGQCQSCRDRALVLAAGSVRAGA